MIQQDKNLSARDKKLLVNNRVLTAVDKIVKLGLAKSALQIGEKTGYDSKNASRYKKGDGFIGTDDIYSLVNEFDLNPSYIFLKDGPEKESLIVERSINNIGDINGDSNSIQQNQQSNSINVHGTVGTLNVVHTLEKLISQVPDELRDQILTQFNYMNGEMDSIKKMADRHEKELIDKKEHLVELKRDLVETKSQLKKKAAQLAESNTELHQTKDELIKVQKNVNDLQSRYVETVKKTEEIIIRLNNSINTKD